MLDEILHILQGPDKKLIILHHNADLDALGSALAIYYNFLNVNIGVPDNLGKGAKQLHKLAGVPVITNPNTDDYPKIIVLDTPSLARLGLDVGRRGNDIIVIDHHTTSEEPIVPMYYSDPTSRSCAEIVYKLLKMARVRISRETAIALITAIVADTAHFRHANISTLETVIEILKESGLDLDHAMSVLTSEPEDMSEKIAVLKGMQRMRFERVDTWLIAGTVVSAHEALICNTMLSIGADVSFVASQRKDEARISARARPHAVRFGFDIGRMFQELGRDVKGEGGGHPGAGGLSYIGDAEALLNISMEWAIKWTTVKLRDASVKKFGHYDSFSPQEEHTESGEYTENGRSDHPL